MEVLFSHAVFEHVYLGHQLAGAPASGKGSSPTEAASSPGRAISGDGRRAVSPRGGRPASSGTRFDLFNVYRYTHGEPEHATSAPLGEPWQYPNGTPTPPPRGGSPSSTKASSDANYLWGSFLF